MFEALEIIGEVNKYLSVLIGVLGLGIYSKVSTPIRMLVVYFVFAAVASLYSSMMGALGQSNLGLFYFYSLMEYVVLGKVFEQIFFAHGIKKNFKLIFYLILSLLFLYTVCFFNSDLFNTESATLVSLLVIGFSIWFFTLFLNTPIPSFQYVALKWLIISVLLYHCVTIIALLFGNLIISFAGDQKSLVWIFRAAVVFFSKLIALVYFGKLGLELLKTRNEK